jgi:hypothetical protein
MSEATARSILRLLAIVVVMGGLVGECSALLAWLQLDARVGSLGLGEATRVASFVTDAAWVGFVGYALISGWGALLWMLSPRLARAVVA